VPNIVTDKNGFIFLESRTFMRILIAEQDPALASFIRKGLEAEHYAVDVSHDGEQVKALASEMNYDVLVLDLNLARLNGVAILRHLRARKPSLPILILTNRSKIEDRVECLDLGADDFMAKQFSFSELSARIRWLLRRSHLPAASVLSINDLKFRSSRTARRARGKTHRAYFKGVWPSRIPHAERRPEGDASDDR
jgi:DNA-binding response OmpR family regulator